MAIPLMRLAPLQSPSYPHFVSLRHNEQSPAALHTVCGLVVIQCAQKVTEAIPMAALHVLPSFST